LKRFKNNKRYKDINQLLFKNLVKHTKSTSDVSLIIRYIING